MMNLVEMKVKDYLQVLSGDDPTPGGGAAGALCGAQGVALFMMVANMTVGKVRYESFEDLNEAALKKGEVLLAEMTRLIDEDAKAFNLVAEAYKLPKATDEEKRIKSSRLAEASIFAASVPFEAMKLALKGLKETRKLVGKSNANLASDLAVAAICLNACVTGSWVNVMINLNSIKDVQKADTFKVEGEKTLEEAKALADEICIMVSQGMA